MTLMDEASEYGSGAEALARAVKLSASDWRKLLGMLVVGLVFIGGMFFGLLKLVASMEVERLDANTSRIESRTSVIESRVQKLESLETDMAVLKTDVGWIRQELENEKKSKSH